MRFNDVSVVDLFAAVNRAPKPLKVVPRQALVERPSAAVPLGSAPDGLPMVLRVRRRAGVRLPVLDELGLTKNEPVPPELEQALASLEHAAARYARSRGVEVIDSTLCYRSQRRLDELMGSTLLSQAIGHHSPLSFADMDGSGQHDMGRVVLTSAMGAGSHSEEVQHRSRRSTITLALPIEGDEALAVRALDDDVLQTKPLLLERLSSFTSAAYHVRDEVGIEETFPFDAQRYADAVSQSTAIGWSVSDADLARSVAQLSRVVHAMHLESRIHGDLKPSNVLIAEGGATPFDSLDIAVGDLCYEATPGWAAPEQILTRPVTPASDVYALGLILAKVLGAVIYGEEKTFIIPSGGSSRRRAHLLADPQVYVDLSMTGIDDGFIKAWEALIRSCITFDVERRLGSAQELGDRIEQLLGEAPPQKRQWLKAGPGQLYRKADHLGQVQACWVIEDGDLI